MLNNITLMGRLVAEPVLRTTSNGISVCSFRVACDRDNVADGGQKTDFIDCVAWRKTGEFVSKYFWKGKPILVMGRLQIRDWTDKDGGKRKATEILVNTVEFCGGDKKPNQNGSAEMAGVPDLTELGGTEDLPWDDHDLPV